MKDCIKLLCASILLIVCTMGCNSKLDMEDTPLNMNEDKVLVDEDYQPPIKLFNDVEEVENSRNEEQEHISSEKQEANSFIYDDLYYFEYEESWYPSEFWERLKIVCVEVIERNTWEEFIEKHEIKNQVMDRKEKEDYAYRDETGILDRYILEKGIEDIWILYTSSHESQDILVKTPCADEESRYIYYFFEMGWYRENHIYYYSALRALGSDEFYFLQYEKKDLFILVERAEQGALKGIAIHQFENGSGQTILYLKIEQENQVSESVMYGGVTGEQKWIGYNSTYWPEYPK